MSIDTSKMLNIVFLTFTLTVLGLGQAQAYIDLFRDQFDPFRPYQDDDSRRPEFSLRRTYKLCTYSALTYTKCIHTVHVAQNNSIELPLECVQKDTRESCLQSVRQRHTDMIVLTGHGYQAARQAGLRPVIYESDSQESFYIAVAPRNISFIDYLEAPIDTDQSNDRAFHAAAFFNFQRGHDICRNAAQAGATSIKIVDFVQYTPNADEILLCADGTYAEAAAYKECNVETGLQRAVFVNKRLPRFVIRQIKSIFDTILERFSADSTQSDVEFAKSFNFFNTFQGSDDVIFKNNAISFDAKPTYRNGVTEGLFNLLHCNNADQEHNPSQLQQTIN